MPTLPLSNCRSDDLLEILGQARDPVAVQPHVRKCFEAVKSLEMKEAVGRKHHEAIGLNSPEKEYIPLANNVICQGAVEAWLLAVEVAMISTLTQLLFRCYGDMKKTKREKWIRDWAGQMTLTSGQVAWTVECTKALHAMSEGQKNAMRQAKKKQVSTLTKLCDMVRGNMGKLDRKKTVAIVTVEVHSRDVIDRMVKQQCASVNVSADVPHSSPPGVSESPTHTLTALPTQVCTRVSHRCAPCHAAARTGL